MHQEKLQTATKDASNHPPWKISQPTPPIEVRHYQTKPIHLYYENRRMPDNISLLKAKPKTLVNYIEFDLIYIIRRKQIILLDSNAYSNL